jgi:hypothetical protein
MLGVLAIGAHAVVRCRCAGAHLPVMCCWFRCSAATSPLPPPTPQDALLDAAIEGDVLDFDSFASLVAGPCDGSNMFDCLDFYDARAPGLPSGSPPAAPSGMLLGGGPKAGWAPPRGPVRPPGVQAT